MVESLSSTAMTGPNPGDPNGVIDPVHELLESRVLARDFEVEGGTIRVETRIRIGRSPWSISSVVLENGVQIEQEPFAPLTDELDVSAYEPEDLDDIRFELARRVAAIHAERCLDVERALGMASGVVHPASGRRIAVIAFLGLLLVGAGGAGYYVWRQGSQTPPTQDLTNPTDVEAPSEASSMDEVAASPIGDTTVGGAQKIGPPAARVPPSPAPMPRTQARTSGASSEHRPDSADASSRQDERRTRADSSSVASDSTPSISDVRPAHYQIGPLALGSYAYSDDDAVFVSAPPSQLGSLCVRTSNRDRTRDGSVSFVVDRDVRVLVGHDPRLKKKPRWLEAFTPTGQRWEVEGVGLDEGVVTYEVYVRSFAPGMVSLGSNVAWTKITRRLRRTFEKDLAMYVVCVEVE